MAAVDIPGVKRAGLPVELDRLARFGDTDLTLETRYALKTHGVCAQLQERTFMVRIRVPGGLLLSSQARALAGIARRFGRDWLHVTTRQNLELHWVSDRSVPDVLDEIERTGLTTRSTCGHTLRNVMCADDAGVGLDEPFDCLPDAQLVSASIVARSKELNCVLPSRVNLAFGGSPRCRHDALLNDGAFVSTVHDGDAGYELWAGGSLGRSPRLAVLLDRFVPRSDAVAAAEALIDVFVAHGDLDHPTKGRMKYVLERLGEDEFRAAWRQAFAARRTRARVPEPPAVLLLPDVDRATVLSFAPRGGWTSGVRPQRTPGLAMITVDVPMGDVDGAAMEALAFVAERYGDSTLRLTRDQDVLVRDVPIRDVDAVRNALGTAGMKILGEGSRPRVRACTGSAVCALGITTAPDAGAALLASTGLHRNASLRVHISGCPNSCAQHQAADIGLAGAKVRIGGVVHDGYQVFVGADLDRHLHGEVVGRTTASDVVTAVDVLVGVWEALRHDGEPLGRTFRRIGLDAIAAHVEARLDRGWESGADDDTLATSAA